MGTVGQGNLILPTITQPFHPSLAQTLMQLQYYLAMQPQYRQTLVMSNNFAIHVNFLRHKQILFISTSNNPPTPNGL